MSKITDDWIVNGNPRNLCQTDCGFEQFSNGEIVKYVFNFSHVRHFKVIIDVKLNLIDEWEAGDALEIKADEIGLDEIESEYNFMHFQHICGASLIEDRTLRKHYELPHLVDQLNLGIKLNKGIIIIFKLFYRNINSLFFTFFSKKNKVQITNEGHHGL